LIFLYVEFREERKFYRRNRSDSWRQKPWKSEYINPTNGAEKKPIRNLVVEV
jgi:hypothetical protein